VLSFPAEYATIHANKQTVGSSVLRLQVTRFTLGTLPCFLDLTHVSVFEAFHVGIYSEVLLWRLLVEVTKSLHRTF
jgi:hypothetical protein